MTDRTRTIVSLSGVCLLSGFLNLWGIRTGLPSNERRSVSLGGPVAIDAAEPAIREVIAARIADRSEFVPGDRKRALADLSPYFDQLRTFHPDEQYILKTLVRMARDRDLDPRSYIYGPFYFYQVGAGLAVARGIGTLPETGDVVEPMRHPDRFARAYLAARCTSATFGVGTVCLVFLLGLRLGGLRIAVVAAGLMACTPLAVLSCMFVKPDAMATFWATLSLWFCVRALRAPRLRDSLLAGVCVGLAAGSKYPGVLCFAHLVSFHLLRRWPDIRRGRWFAREDRLLLAGGMAAAGAFLATNPAVLTGPAAFWRDVGWIAGEMRDDSLSRALVDGIVSYGQDAFLYAMGPAATIAALAGIVRTLRLREGAWCALLPALLLFLVFTCRGRPGSDAYLLPAYPVLMLAAARAIAAVRDRRRWTLLAAATLGITASWGWAYVSVAGRENVRVTAARWINENVPEGASIGMRQYPVGYRVPMVSPVRFRLRSQDFDADAARADYFLSSSFEWSCASWEDRLRRRPRVDAPVDPAYRVVAEFEEVPRALFGLLPLCRSRPLSPYFEVVAPRITVYERAPS